MYNLLRAELFKLQRNKAFWALIVSVTGLSALLHSLILTEWWFLSGTPFDRAGLSEFNALSMFIVPLFFNLIVSTLAGFFISTEFTQNGVIKNQVLSGNKRTHIYMAKFLVLSLGSVIVTVVIPIVLAIIMALLFGRGEIFTASNILFLGRAYSLFIPHFLSFVAIVLFIAIVTEDSGKTILFTLLLSVAMFAIEKLVTISLIQTLYENTFFYQFNVVFNATISNGEIIKTIIIGILSIFILLLAGMLIFNKKEIK